jgi:hypothetical protein
MPPPIAPEPMPMPAPGSLDVTMREITEAAMEHAVGVPKGLPLKPQSPQTLARQEPTEVVHMTVEPADYSRELEPRSMNQVIELSKHLHASRLFSAYGTPQAVMATVLAGREFGMPAMASLRGFHIIEGKPTLAADTIRALILKSGAAKFFRCTERTAERATFETQRGDDPPIALSYTIQEGRKAFPGKDDKWEASAWGKSPHDMLVARASAKLARLVFPDVVHGLYSPEEFD